jgi:hypothetical protein
LPQRALTRDPAAASAAATVLSSCRLPAGHPEGFLEAFANIYTAAFEDMVARAVGATVVDSGSLYPKVQDGVEGVAFVSRCLASSLEQGAWKRLDRTG